MGRAIGSSSIGWGQDEEPLGVERPVLCGRAVLVLFRATALGEMNGLSHCSCDHPRGELVREGFVAVRMRDPACGLQAQAQDPE